MSDRTPETRIVPCFTCEGDAGWEGPPSRIDGSGRWHNCEACNRTGEVEIEVEPISMEDIEATS